MSKVQANEVNYELHSLGWKAFQNLCSTIVSEIWGQTVQTFFDSHDGGRDGAFKGVWNNSKEGNYSGTFTVQCKHTTKVNSILRLSDLTDELEKAKRLASKGLSDNYFLFSNAKLTGKNDEEIRSEFEKIPEIKNCLVIGGERISLFIRESKRLRMLVPRIYGLGDLSQILDERAYEQAREILSSLGNELHKFIITDAYRQSSKALVDHGFVLLLGEPMCGKSTIAAALSLGALDEWGCSTIKVRNADEFVQHFNPNEKQLFWVDDAFGPTQTDFESAINWSRTFPHVKAAIHKGAKIIFTSRDYVYKGAKQFLKESALPVMKESQVVIQVEELSTEEKEQILYNHIRLGNQSGCFKSKIKPFLPEIASNKKFSPEIARRLGDSFFTKNLNISSYDLIKFVQNPLDILCEVISTMDDASRSALALVFIRGGILPSPLCATGEEENAIARLGGDVGQALKGLESLNGSLLINTINEGCYYWQFKHPTIRDAFAAIVASTPDLMDIYLTGAPLEKLFSEISCGDLGIKGVSVIVPSNQYHIIIDKIRNFDTSKWYNKSSLNGFLYYRCGKEFLSNFIVEFPEFISQLQVRSYIYACSDIDVLVSLQKYGLLPEAVRVCAVNEIKNLAISVPDSGFLRDEIRSLLSDNEFSEILSEVKGKLLPNLEGLVDDWKADYSFEHDPDSYFDELKTAIDDYKSIFSGDDESEKHIDLASALLSDAISELQTEYSSSNLSSAWDNNSVSSVNNTFKRSIFDDIDY